MAKTQTKPATKKAAIPPSPETARRDAARSALLHLPGYEPGLSEASWQSREPASQAEVVFRKVPARLEGIARLLLALTSGSNEERDAARWFLYDALNAEARALRLAVLAVRYDEDGFIRRDDERKGRRS